MGAAIPPGREVRGGSCWRWQGTLVTSAKRKMNEGSSTLPACVSRESFTQVPASGRKAPAKRTFCPSSRLMTLSNRGPGLMRMVALPENALFQVPNSMLGAISNGHDDPESVSVGIEGGDRPRPPGHLTCAQELAQVPVPSTARRRPSGRSGVLVVTHRGLGQLDELLLPRWLGAVRVGRRRCRRGLRGRAGRGRR